MNRRHFIKNTTLATLAFPAFYEKRDADVIIIGAGLSGLYTAMLLEKKGIKTLILEGNTRIGGRLWSKDGVNLGGVEIGNGYKRLVEIAKNLNVELVEPMPSNRDLTIHFKGQNILSKDWAKADINPLDGIEKAIAPHLLEFSAIKNNPLKTISDWAKPEFRDLDIPLSNFLKKNGSSDMAIELMNVAANYNDIHSVSTLNILRGAIYRTAGGSTKALRIKGGSQALPEAMAKSLKIPILQGKKVVSIDNSGKNVKIKCEDGSKYQASKVITTVPFPVFKKIKVEKLTDMHRQAIDKTQTTKINQIFIEPKKEFWKEDGLPLSMWTDTPLERFLTEGNDRFLFWVNGSTTAFFNKMSENEVKNYVKTKFSEIRPAAKDNFEVSLINAWEQNPFSGGTYFELQAGQAAWFEHWTKPVNNLFFAGEHTALEARGMEAALESSERVVAQLNN
jgi:monoamine oxidase